MEGSGVGFNVGAEVAERAGGWLTKLSDSAGVLGVTAENGVIGVSWNEKMDMWGLLVALEVSDAAVSNGRLVRPPQLRRIE
jgi:hypothetical protein